MKTKIVIFFLMVYASMSAQKIYTIPFVLDKYFECSIPLVHVYIDGNKKLFIVDSGSDRSIITRDHLEFFQCVKNYSVDISCVGGCSSSGVISIYRIPVFGINHVFECHDLWNVNNSIKRFGFKEDIYGILGSDFLRAHKATIDYDKKTLTITVF